MLNLFKIRIILAISTAFSTTLAIGQSEAGKWVLINSSSEYEIYHSVDHTFELTAPGGRRVVRSAVFIIAKKPTDHPYFGYRLFADCGGPKINLTDYRVYLKDIRNEYNDFFMQIDWRATKALNLNDTTVPSTGDSFESKYGEWLCERKWMVVTPTVSQQPSSNANLAVELIKEARSLTDTQRNSFSESKVGLRINFEGKLFNAIDRNPFLNKNSKKYADGQNSLVIDLPNFAKAYVNLSKIDLSRYSNMNRGTPVNITCKLTSVSDYHISCDYGW